MVDHQTKLSRKFDLMGKFSENFGSKSAKSDVLIVHFPHLLSPLPKLSLLLPDFGGV